MGASRRSRRVACDDMTAAAHGERSNSYSAAEEHENFAASYDASHPAETFRRVERYHRARTQFLS